MCGIIGYAGRRPARDLILGGLARLEYRGYDSAGLALSADGRLEIVRAVGQLANLEAAAGPSGATVGIGHTRWATHGGITEENAHPLRSCDGSLALVLNGIVENHLALRAELQARGHVFRSETDAEV